MDTVRVEGFGSTLRGHKIWVVGDETLVPNRLHVLEQELLGRGKRVLILADGRKHIPRWANTFDWDVIFRVRDGFDLRLAITYVQNAAKPTRVVWLGEEPSPQVLSKIAIHDVSLIGFGSTHPRADLDVIYFGGGMEAGRIEDVLMPKMGASKLAGLNLKSVIPELRAVKAGLVWSSIGEPERSGSVYWYDIGEGDAPPEPFNPIEAAHLLKEVADRLLTGK
jgi:hypothetical protein